MSTRGFEALSLSLWGAWRLFGPEPDYVVCVNTVTVDDVRRRLGETPPDLLLVQAQAAYLPAWLRPCIDSTFAGGAAWKLAPVRVAPACLELSLDNDLILWRMPSSLAGWLDQGSGYLCAEDVARTYGKLDPLCDEEPRNSAIRGLPPGFSYDVSLRRLAEGIPLILDSAADERGLEVAALERRQAGYVVDREEVGSQSLGSHGAHFAGLNAKKPSSLHRDWDGWRTSITQLVRDAHPERIAA